MGIRSTTEQVSTRPFHETIVGAIRRCSNPSSGEIFHLFQLIKDTNIPQGHYKIIAEIHKFFDFLGAEKWAREIREVKESILEQKRANTPKVEGENKGINLDDLQRETEKLSGLLKDRQPGLITWNEALREQLQKMHQLTAQALGK